MKNDEIYQLKNHDKLKGAHKRIYNSYGVTDYYKFYKSKGGTLDRKTFSEILTRVNEKLGERLLEKKAIDFPYGMGRMEIKKFKTKVCVGDNGIETNLPPDWETTLKLWAEDEEAREAKTIIRQEVPYVFRAVYIKYNAVYKNKQFFTFTIGRTLKRKMKDLINKGEMESFLMIKQ